METFAQGYDYTLDADGNQIAISRATGEVVPATTLTVPVGSDVYTPEDKAALAEKKEKQREFFEDKTLLEQMGNFVFVYGGHCFNDVTPETAARLVFLSTYLRHGTDELFTSTGRRGGDKPIRYSDLPSVLGLSRQTVGRLFSEAGEKYIRKDDAGCVHMNRAVFCRGSLYDGAGAVSWRKTYIKAVQKLYRAMLPSKHRYFGYVLQVLPYLNIQFNILCHNPGEKRLDSVRPMTVEEFCDCIEYRVADVHRLREVYRQIQLKVGDHTEPFLAFVEAGRETRIFANPRVLYSGTRPGEVAVLGCFCKGGGKKS